MQNTSQITMLGAILKPLTLCLCHNVTMCHNVWYTGSRRLVLLGPLLGQFVLQLHTPVFSRFFVFCSLHSVRPADSSELVGKGPCMPAVPVHFLRTPRDTTSIYLTHAKHEA